ncbi:MAG: tyrosine-type recombinase/integrase [Candidatus Methanofastidiosia archaeon]|jgi:site-specific recombinase XerD
MVNDDQETVYSRMEYSFTEYGWTLAQQKVFKEFVEERFANYSNPVNTILGYLSALNHVVESNKKPFSEITFKDLRSILQKWQEENSPATVHGWRGKLRAFLRWESGNKHDPRAEKIRAGSYVSPITLSDLLTEDEIVALREVAKDNPRDLAMIDFHLLWGPRPAESAKLKIGDVQVSDRYIVVNIPQTKTIFRPVPIPLAKVSVIKDPVFLDSALNAYTSLMHYLNIHPGYPDNPEYPLWYNTNDGCKNPLSKDGVTAVFRRLGKNAGLEKSVTTYVLRRTAFNRFKGADREKLNAGFGWKPGSRMPTTVYNKLRPQDVLETLIEEEDEQPRNIEVCPQCQKENPNDLTFCAWCGTPLVELPATATLEQFHADKEAQEELERLKRENKELGDRMNEIEEKLIQSKQFERDFPDFAIEDPKLLKEMKKFLEMIELFEKRPELYNEMKALVKRT